MTKSIEEHFVDWEAHVFGYGYGTGEEHIIPAVKRFFAAITDKNLSTYDYEELSKACGAPTAWLLITIFCKEGLIDYGVSSRIGWLTDSGKALKEFFDSHTDDELVDMAVDSDDHEYCTPSFCSCLRSGENQERCQNPFWS